MNPNLGKVGIETRVGGPRGPKPGRKPGILVGKDRARKLRREYAELEAARGVAPKVDIKPRAFYQEMLNDTALPLDWRMNAARFLLQFERPGDDVPARAIDWSKLTVEEREVVKEALEILSKPGTLISGKVV